MLRRTNLILGLSLALAAGCTSKGYELGQSGDDKQHADTDPDGDDEQEADTPAAGDDEQPADTPAAEEDQQQTSTKPASANRASSSASGLEDDVEPDGSDDTVSNPADDTEPGGSDDTVSNPADDTEPGGSDDTGSSPADDTRTDPADDTETNPGDDTEANPADDTETHPSHPGSLPDWLVLPSDDLNGCFGFMNARSRPMEYRYWEYDRERRILSQHQLYQIMEEPTPDAPRSVSIYFVFDASGYLVTHATFPGGTTGSFRELFGRDEHHNLISVSRVTEDWTDLTEPATAEPDYYYNYSHSYDETGALESSTLLDSDQIHDSASVYTHDDEGRCASIETTSEYAGTVTVETFDYADGQVVEHVEQTTRTWMDVLRDGDDEPRRYVTRYAYDDEGRLITREWFGTGPTGGEPTLRSVDYWFYQADGSVARESRLYTSQSPNVWIGDQSFYQSIQVFSSDCRALVDQIPRPDPSLACQFANKHTSPGLWPRRP